MSVSLGDSSSVPFPDEEFAQNIEVVHYRSEWATEGVELAAELARMLPGAMATDHIGSTSVPGLPAKDCIDLMVRVESLSDMDLSPLTQAGYRERSEEWNRNEALGTTTYPKRVFAPPLGGRRVNIHFREAQGETARYSLLFHNLQQCLRESRPTRVELGWSVHTTLLEGIAQIFCIFPKLTHVLSTTP